MAKKNNASSLPIAILAYIPALYFLVYPFFAQDSLSKWSVLACVFIYLGSLALWDGARGSARIMRVTFWIFFVFYLFMIVSFTLFDGVFGRHIDLSALSFDAIKSYAETHSNLIPFKTIGDFFVGFNIGTVSRKAFITNIGGNLLAFVPFAFFMPLLFTKMKKFWRFLLFIGLFVIAIELLQLVLMTGSLDVDDFILNVTGALICYALFRYTPLKNGIHSFTKLDI